MDKRFGLKTNCIADIVNILKLQPEVEEALIFGSRAMGTYRNGSDIDIALKGEKISFDTISTIRLRLDELPYLYMYDVIDYKKISNPALTAHIDDLGITFYKKENVPKEWKTYKLEDLIDVQNGYAFKSEDFSEKGIPVIKIKNIVPPRIFFGECEHFDGLIDSRMEQFLVKKGDILISMTGSHLNQIASAVGKVGKYSFDFPALLNQRVGRLHPKDKSVLNENFFFYFISRIETQIDLVTSAGGSGNQANISPAQIKNLKLSLPDIKTQTQIAQILSSLDDKIELNLQMNQTLEAMAQAIFKEWFVNFNFPGFDGELVDGLPKGWRMGNILEIATLLSGGTPKTEVPEYWNGDINWISAKDITSSNNQFIIETEKTITEIGIKKSAAKLLPIFTTVISARGTVGNFCILSKEMAISQSNYGLKSNLENNFFLFLMVKNMILMMKAFSYGTVFDTITTKTFKEMEITIPKNATIKEFEKIINPIYSKILTNQLQIQYLTQTRDTLLPKLMSGQISLNH